MTILDFITTVAMFLIGVIIGTMVVGLAGAFGVAGWVAGLVLGLLIFIFIYLHDKLQAFETKHVVRLIARLVKIDIKAIEAEQRAEDQGPRKEYYGFFVGAIIGTLASIVWTPSAIFDLLPF